MLKPVLPERKLFNFRISIKVFSLVETIAEEWGTSKTHVIEEAVRRLYRNYKIKKKEK